MSLNFAIIPTTYCIVRGHERVFVGIIEGCASMRNAHMVILIVLFHVPFMFTALFVLLGSTATTSTI